MLKKIHLTFIVILFCCGLSVSGFAANDSTSSVNKNSRFFVNAATGLGAMDSIVIRAKKTSAIAANLGFGYHLSNSLDLGLNYTYFSPVKVSGPEGISDWAKPQLNIVSLVATVFSPISLVNDKWLVYGKFGVGYQLMKLNPQKQFARLFFWDPEKTTKGFAPVFGLGTEYRYSKRLAATFDLTYFSGQGQLMHRLTQGQSH